MIAGFFLLLIFTVSKTLIVNRLKVYCNRTYFSIKCDFSGFHILSTGKV